MDRTLAPCTGTRAEACPIIAQRIELFFQTNEREKAQIMANIEKPVMFKAMELPNFTGTLTDHIREAVGKDADLLLDYPAVYVHVWQSGDDSRNERFSIYVGESDDVVRRTEEHWRDARSETNWQHHMLTDKDKSGNTVVPTVYLFGHKCFHKSFTLDMENRLIDFCLAMDTAHLYNARTNPQRSYSGDENADAIFMMIWKMLRKDNPSLFLSQYDITKSAIYKASPNHKLTQEQKRAKDFIKSKTMAAIDSGKSGQLVLVEGGAGTGKTVLTSCAFFEMLDCCHADGKKKLKCFLLVNHDEQQIVYSNMARKLRYDEEYVQNPTAFIRTHSVTDSDTKEYKPDLDNIVDVAFVDEAHLLWSSHNQGYDRHYPGSQLEEIIKRARVTVVMLDSNQVLHNCSILDEGKVQRLRDSAIAQSSYFILHNQLRIKCAPATLSWLDGITKHLEIADLKLGQDYADEKGYEVRVFDDPKSLHEAIKRKHAKPETELSRVVATSDWPYVNNRAAGSSKYWEVKIGDWTIPWNEQIFGVDIYPVLGRRKRARYKTMSWVEKPYSIDEAGSTFTVQGFDLSYVGVIIGPSVRYDKIRHQIWFDETQRTFHYMKGKKTMQDGKTISSRISQNELNVLLTRGTRGLYIFACDPDLQVALKTSIRRTLR